MLKIITYLDKGRGSLAQGVWRASGRLVAGAGRATGTSDRRCRTRRRPAGTPRRTRTAHARLAPRSVARCHMTLLRMILLTNGKVLRLLMFNVFDLFRV